MKSIVLLIFLVIFISCSDNKDKTNSTINDTSKVNSNLIVPPISDSFYMNYKFKKGDLLNYRITTISTSSQEILSDSVITTISRQNVVYNVKLKVAELDSAKNAKINVLVESIFVDGDINGQKMNYNSNLIQSSQERMIFGQYEAIKKKQFSVILSKHGEILNIYNIDAILNELLDIQQQKNLTTAQKNEIRENLVVSVLKPLSEQIFRKFPSKKISKNYSWVDKYYSQFALFQIENIASFQIQDVQEKDNDSTIIIGAGLSINWIGDNKTSENGMNFYFYDPVVSGEGKINFDKNLGLITYSNTSTRMQMETDIDGVDETGKSFKAKRTDNTKNTNVVELRR